MSRERTTARNAAKAISPGAIKNVHFHFVGIGGAIGERSTGWLRVPKREAKRMLRALYPCLVVLAIEGDQAYIRGEWADHSETQ